MSKNELKLKSFTKYCKAHPEERFYQALVNWSYEKNNRVVGIDLVFISKDRNTKTTKDAFYLE